MGLSDRFRRRLAEAEMANLPLILQPRHRPNGFLNRHLRVDAVLVVEIDDIDVQPPQARLARRADIVGVATNAEELAGFAPDVPELGGNENAVSMAGNRAADEFLVAANAVHVGRVEEVQAL